MLRRLSEQDREHLEGFACRDFRAPYTTPVEEAIRSGLTSALADPAIHAAGWWEGDRLAGVVVWQYQDTSEGLVCVCSLLAVRTGFAGRGIGGRLKEEVVEHARHEGAVVVESEVHWDNDVMIRINTAYPGASVVRMPGEKDYCRCIIPLGAPHTRSR